MFSYILRIVMRRTSRNIVLVIGLLTLSTGMSTYVSANQNASVTVSTTIDQHWRGAYDLLVRPQNSAQPTEQRYGLVEGNYLSVGKSGISVQQWKQIETLAGVEIAAPVATIGYVRNTSGNISIVIPPQKEDALYRINVNVGSNNGYRTTSLINSNEYYAIAVPKSTPVQGIEALKNVLLTTVGSFSVDPQGGVAGDVRPPPVVWTLIAGVDPAAERKLAGLDKAIVTGQYLNDNDGITTEKVPDPLTGNYTDKNGNRDRERWHEDVRNYRINPDGPNIPIISANSTYLSLPTTITVDKLKMLDLPTLEQVRSSPNPASSRRVVEGAKDQVRKGLDALRQPVERQMVSSSFDYGAILRPLLMRPLGISLVDGQASVQTKPDLVMFVNGGMEKAYRPGAINYTRYEPSFDAGNLLTLAAVAVSEGPNMAAEPKLDAQTVVSLTGETAFRSLPLAPPAMAPTQQPQKDNSYRSPFSFQEVGTYDLNKLPASVKNQDPLTYVPLGIYQPPLVTLVRDAQGNPLPGGPVPLRPTINPASFIPGPPLALTNIAAARFFRGDNPIDAIRVRVGGIDRYTPENVQKVADVAAQIIKSTGLRVDIVAGSSPQKVLVYIPGSPDGKVAPLGYVEEAWTTLGAAAAITSGIDRASVLMLGGTGLAGLLYLVSQSLLSTLAKRRELALLGAVGWRRRHISSLVVGEAAVVGLLGGLCASVLGVLLAAGLGLAAPLEQAAGIGLAVLLLYVFASVGPAMWIVRQPVAGLLQRGEVALPAVGTTRVRAGAQPKEEPPSEAVTRAAGKGWTGVRGVAVFAWRTLYSRRARSLLAGGSLAVATLLLTLISVSLAALGGTLRVTLLGQYVGLQVQAYHLVMVGSAVIMSVLAVGDHLAMGVLERKQELALLQAIGWRRGAVRVSILIEGLWLGLIGGVAGALVAVGVLLVLASNGASLLASGWWVLPLSVATMLVLCGLSALYAMSLTARQSLVRAMQQ